MAFDVTPTSGDAPYTFTADFLNKNAFNNGYVLRFSRTTESVGSCLPPEETSINTAIAASLLLSEGVYERLDQVSDGACQTFALRIFDELDNVVDMQYVTVSNI